MFENAVISTANSRLTTVIRRPRISVELVDPRDVLFQASNDQRVSDGDEVGAKLLAATIGRIHQRGNDPRLSLQKAVPFILNIFILATQSTRISVMTRHNIEMRLLWQDGERDQ